MAHEHVLEDPWSFYRAKGVKDTEQHTEMRKLSGRYCWNRFKFESGCGGLTHCRGWALKGEMWDCAELVWEQTETTLAQRFSVSKSKLRTTALQSSLTPQ